MKEKILNAVKYLFFLALGVGLLMYISRDLNFGEVVEEAATMNFWFFGVSGLMALASHYSRAVRWKFLIETQGHNPTTINVFLSVLIMYISNLVLPRSGEVARCGTLYKYEKIPVPQLLGTVVVERFIDLIVLGLGTLLLVTWQFDIVLELYQSSKLPDLVHGVLGQKWSIVGVFVALLLIVGLLFMFRKKLAQLSIYNKVRDLLFQVLEGMKKVMALEKKWLFLGHTIFIWLMYFGMTYICFFAYEPTSSLGVAAGFAVFTAGSFGMVAPTNGGIGAWHFMVITTLGIYGIASKEATLIANIAFVIMTLTVAFYGVIALILVSGYNRKISQEKK